MKTSNFLTFISIYGLIVGGMMLFNATGSLQNYGINPIDKYHIAIIEYLGVANLTFSILAFLFRNSIEKDSLKNVLIVFAFINIGSVLKAFYDVFLAGLILNDFIYYDMSFRLLVGFACIYFAFKTNEK